MLKSKQIIYLILIFATFSDILLLFYAALHPVSSTFRFGVYSFDIILCVVLWIEFIYSYLKSDNKKQYLIENSLSILGMLPINFVFLRALRLLKLIQLIKLFVLARDSEKNLSNFLKHTYLDKIILVAIIFIFILTVSVRILEPNITDINTAFWYIIVSITNTGYGDIVPSSLSGRIVGIIAMIGGILVFASFTAVISSLYISKIGQDNHDDLNTKIENLTSEIERLNEKIDELKKE
ncbi:ion channel [uncultured Methanobrevibacter sp.]|uniref:ion channel n=1 Tax=uncultured Methanobrevibacter sp. TaxID=253161 RepID=UPI0025DF0139|nr:ion channel [uncultured Methanobrevibacter sp.]